MNKGRFKKGDIPANGKKYPLGSERVNPDGYVEVKVSAHPLQANGHGCWVPKHRQVWEEANGEIPPKTTIVFADGNKRNFDLENLVAVPRSLWATICRLKIPYFDKDSLQVAMDIASLKRTSYALKKKL